jgi:histone-lysine N-methyltransferase SUV420H
MPSQASPPKKQRLTLTQLASYDDILTDALVDHVSPLSGTMEIAPHTL